MRYYNMIFVFCQQVFRIFFEKNSTKSAASQTPLYLRRRKLLLRCVLFRKGKHGNAAQVIRGANLNAVCCSLYVLSRRESVVSALGKIVEEGSRRGIHLSRIIGVAISENTAVIGKPIREFGSGIS